MADFNKVAQNVAEVAERVADVSDAARGRGSRKSGAARWLILPALGAGVYAVAKKGSAFGRTAKELAGQAKDRVSEMPDLDLLGRVKEVAGFGDNGQQEDEVEPTRRQPRSQTAQLEGHRRERAERRERRRKSISAMN